MRAPASAPRKPVGLPGFAVCKLHRALSKGQQARPDAALPLQRAPMAPPTATTMRPPAVTVQHQQHVACPPVYPFLHAGCSLYHWTPSHETPAGSPWTLNVID